MNRFFEILRTDTGNDSVLRVALLFEEQTDVWELGTMIAPQTMFTPILLGVKAIKDAGLFLQCVPEKLESTFYYSISPCWSDLGQLRA